MGLFEEVRKLLAGASLLDEEEIRPSHMLEADLGIDSFGTMEIVISIESSFGVTVRDKDLKCLITVQDVVDFISKNSTSSKEQRRNYETV